MAVAVALVRGFQRSRSDRIGNFWVDLVRGCLRILLPLAVLGAVVLLATGVVQNLSAGTDATTLAGAHQTLTGGPVASQEAIKELGTNGGGFYNANSAHPFENPNPLSNLFEIFFLLLIPVALTRTFGLMVKDKRLGYALLGAMALLWGLILAGVTVAEMAHRGTALQLAGASMEGKETRFGVVGRSTADPDADDERADQDHERGADRAGMTRDPPLYRDEARLHPPREEDRRHDRDHHREGGDRRVEDGEHQVLLERQIGSADRQARGRDEQHRLGSDVQRERDAEHRHDPERADAVQPARATAVAGAVPTRQRDHAQQHHDDADHYLQRADEGVTLALTSRERLAGDRRQCDGSEGAEHGAGQEGEPAAAAAV